MVLTTCSSTTLKQNKRAQLHVKNNKDASERRENEKEVLTLGSK